jgi:hypothetical protein
MDDSEADGAGGGAPRAGEKHDGSTIATTGGAQHLPPADELVADGTVSTTPRSVWPTMSMDDTAYYWRGQLGWVRSFSDGSYTLHDGCTTPVTDTLTPHGFKYEIKLKFIEWIKQSREMAACMRDGHAWWPIPMHGGPDL